jgi:hypothetical protein
MKKVFFVACLMTIAFMVSAQGGQRQGGFQQTPEQRAAAQEQMKKDLNLNDKQFVDYKKLEDEYYTKLQAARQGGQFDREAMTKLREEQTAKVKAILTADQFKKYEELLAAQRQRMGGGGNR